MKAKKALSEEVEGSRLLRIYVAAARVIHERGFHATTMDDIANAAGVTKPGLYYYVRSKERLLYDIMNYTLDGYERSVQEPASAIADPEERLRALITLHIKSIAHSHGALTIVTEEPAGLTAAHRRAINERKRGFLNFVRKTLQELKDQGRLRDINITATAFAVQAMVMWTAYWFDPEGPLSAEELGKEYAEIFLNGALRPKARASRSARRK
jgi:AcrR family transcriptional regulator